MGRARVFIATSLDGFIAGPNDELDWLDPGQPGVEDTFSPFFEQIGALLMGRRTFDVVRGFGGDWPYGATPVVVATHRPLDGAPPTVTTVSGPIEALLASAHAEAGDRDVYVDGGGIIRSALDAGLIDELTVTVIPVVLGAGRPLFAGVQRRHRLDLTASRPIGGGLVQLTYRPADEPKDPADAPKGPADAPKA